MSSIIPLMTSKGSTLATYYNYVVGHNGAGELGDGSSAAYMSPAVITTKSWSSVSAGLYVCSGIDMANNLWIWGSNYSGACAQATTTAYFASPIQVAGSWKASANGYYHTVAIKSDGTLWSWGLNTNGQLGNGNTTNQSSPIQIGAATNWAKVACGSMSSYAINSSGGLFTFGLNNAGQLGDGTTVSKSSPVQIGGNVWTDVVTYADIQTVLASRSGVLWGWGNNTVGQIGNLSTVAVSSPVQVAGGLTFTNFSISGFISDANSCGVDTLGRLWAWGKNGAGQLGIGTTTNVSSPVQVGTLTNWSSALACSTTSLFINTSNQVFWTGSTIQPFPPITASPVSSPVLLASFPATVTGKTNSYQAFLLCQNLLYNWGSQQSQDANGNVIDCNADGTEPYIPTPTLIGMGRVASFSTSDSSAVSLLATGNTVGFSAAVNSNGSLYTWGYSNYGGLGQGATIWNKSPTLISASSWSSVRCGTDSLLALKSDGTLWATGLNNAGQLAQGNTTNISSLSQIGTATSWVSIWGCNGFTYFALDTSGHLWGWGLNNAGQLGVGDTTNRSSPVQIGTKVWSYISCDSQQSTTGSVLAIDSSGALWAWGDGSNGCLGQGSTLSFSSPVQIGSSTGWTTCFISGGRFAAAINGGALYVWGINNSGQLGLGDTVSRSSPVQVGAQTDWLTVAGCTSKFNNSVMVACKSNGSLYTWGTNFYSLQGGGSINSSTASTSSPVLVSSGGWKNVKSSNSRWWVQT